MGVTHQPLYILPLLQAESSSEQYQRWCRVKETGCQNWAVHLEATHLIGIKDLCEIMSSGGTFVISIKLTSSIEVLHDYVRYFLR